jgi:3-oxoacyl-[acyl-carrier protein] reductase
LCCFSRGCFFNRPDQDPPSAIANWWSREYPIEEFVVMSLNGQTALVTGAARGIGRAIALRLAREQATVGLMDLRDPGPVAEEMQVNGFSTIPFRVDITDRESVNGAVRTMIQRYGKIDVLVNNAGIIVRGSILDLSYEDWQRVMNVNINGTFNCCKAVIPHMIERSYGRIVNITSIAGKMGDITASPAYGTSKGAINTFTKSLARQLAAYNINVNAVAPHAIETDMSAEWSEEKRRAIVDSIPAKRLGKPEEVAEAVLFLVSEGASFITGEILDVNGGYLMD